jgi:hypothetical protein
VTVAEGTFSLPGGYIAILDTDTFAAAGSMDFIADWTSPLDDIDIAVANGACTSAQLSAGACTFAGLEESATLKPEQLTLALSASSYTPLIGNFTLPTELISYRITFTPNAAVSTAEVRRLLSYAAAEHRAVPVLVPAPSSFSGRK